MTGPDRDYGLVEIDEMDTDDYNKKKEEFLEKEFKKTIIDLEKLQRETVGQADIELWRVERKKWLTASKFGNVCKLRPSTSCVSTVHNILYSSVQTKAMKHGIEMEETAKKILAEKHGIIVKDSGLVIDTELQFLAASPG